MVVAVEVTPYHKTQLVGLFIGGLDSSSGGQDSSRGKAVLVPQEVVIADAKDVENYVSLQDKNKLLKYSRRY
jgi:hypothetical protein